MGASRYQSNMQNISLGDLGHSGKYQFRKIEQSTTPKVQLVYALHICTRIRVCPSIGAKISNLRKLSRNYIRRTRYPFPIPSSNGPVEPLVAVLWKTTLFV